MSSSTGGLIAAILGEFLLFAGTAAAYVAFSKRNGGGGSASSGLTESLQAGTSLNAKERICTVDENNVPTSNGHFRNEMRLRKLWHRATYVLVLHKPPHDNAKGEQEQYVLVQRRSMKKDYCPGKLDPCPGGVVGYGESYLDNAKREIQEEMGIDVSSSDAPNSLTRLFTFPYQDTTVRVWGDFYEAEFRGDIRDLVLQEEEVESIERISMTELRRMMAEQPQEFMTDCLHALQLYFQRKEDDRLQRKLLHGYSSGNLDEYKLRPKPHVVFFDCDDTLYFDGWIVANMLTKNIENWCVNHGLRPGQAYELYKKYGTALRGLLAEGYLAHSEEAIDGFLNDVHDLPIDDHIEKDEKLRKLLLMIDPSIKKYIFTASVKHHAERCLKALGIDDLFDGIIDCKDCNLETKHDRRSFEVAMKIAGVEHPESCLFLDDSLKNLHTSREMGWRGVLVGRVGRDCGTVLSSEHAEHEIDKIHDFPLVLPELFSSSI